MREWRLPSGSEPKYKLGDSLNVSVFARLSLWTLRHEQGQRICRTDEASSLQGFPASHGTERKHRAPGSICAFAMNSGMGGGLKKGKKMGGQMGNCRVTSKNHVLVSVDQENNLLVVKGTVQGRPGQYCIVKTAKSLVRRVEPEMIELTVYNTNGKQVDTIRVDESVLGGCIRYLCSNRRS